MEEYNILKLAKFIISETKSKSKIKIFNSEIAQPQQFSLDISEILKFGYEPKVNLEESVRKTIEW